MLPLLGLLLLLLLGRLSCAEPEADSTYIHGVLRQLTTQVTEQKVQLQTTMDRLKDSESLVKELQVDLQQTQKELKDAMNRLEVSEGVIKEQRTEFTAAVRRLKASVETTKARTNATQHEVQVLQKRNEVRRVSFSASLWNPGRSGYAGPYNVHTILVFRRVFTNVGDGYSSDTGLFTAPLRGVYHFSFHLHGHGGSHQTAAILFKNGQHEVSAFENQPTGHQVSPSIAASLLLEAGDVVCVKLWSNARVFDNRNYHTIFNGHLLFPM